MMTLSSAASALDTSSCSKDVSDHEAAENQTIVLPGKTVRARELCELGIHEL